LQRSGRGDEIVVVRVVTPTRLTQKQKSLLRELGTTLGTAEIQPPNKGFFDKLKDALGIP
jgi:molecular chaperone DnaJ